jgi:hypothetical protein
MSPMMCERTLQGTERPDWPGLGPLRWPYLVFDREEVALSAVPAVCLTDDGLFWEYDGRRFLVTDADTGVWRAPAVAGGDVPSGPWRHVPCCTCESCRLGNV